MRDVIKDKTISLSSEQKGNRVKDKTTSYREEFAAEVHFPTETIANMEIGESELYDNIPHQLSAKFL